MHKQTVVQPYNGRLFSNEKEQTSDTCNNMGESQINFAEWNKPDQKSTYCEVQEQEELIYEKKSPE